MRRLHSLKSTHWVMWSSPVLLLILVFTLTASSSSTPLRHSAAPPPSSRTSTTTTNTTTTTPTTTTTTTDPPRKLMTVPASSVKIVTRVITVPIPSTTTASPSVSSSSATASSVGSVASAPAENASSGVLSGQLSPSFNVADLPLAGPGTWDVASSAPAKVTLACSGTTIDVTSQFVIGAKAQCQVSITATTPGDSLTWQLTPVH